MYYAQTVPRQIMLRNISTTGWDCARLVGLVGTKSQLFTKILSGGLPLKQTHKNSHRLMLETLALLGTELSNMVKRNQCQCDVLIVSEEN